jgi:hypothetical protein
LDTQSAYHSIFDDLKIDSLKLYAQDWCTNEEHYNAYDWVRCIILFAQLKGSQQSKNRFSLVFMGPSQNEMNYELTRRILTFMQMLELSGGVLPLMNERFANDVYRKMPIGDYRDDWKVEVACEKKISQQNLTECQALCCGAWV